MSHPQLSRRQLLKASAVGTAFAATPALLRPQTAQADPDVRTAGQWIPSTENPIVRRGNYEQNTAETVSFVTLMNVSTKAVSNRRAGWYMWHWTHPSELKANGSHIAGASASGNICRLYGSSTPWRGWVALGTCNFPAPGGSFDPGHLEAGDVVWNGDHFLCTPHSLDWNTGPARQNTFLYRSTDGQNWQKVLSGPMLSHGSSDNKHIGYGRFLRDMTGNLKRIGGKAYWYYNGREHDGSDLGICRLHLAESSNLTTWTKAFNNPLKSPLSGSYFELGSALYSNGFVWLFSSMGQPGMLTYDQARYADDPYHFNAGPGIPFYSTGSFLGGPSYAADPVRHFMTLGTLPPPTVPSAGGRFQIDMLYTNN